MFFTREKTGAELLERFILKDKPAIQMERIFSRTDILRKNRIRFDESLNNAEDQLFTATVPSYIRKASCIDRILYRYV